MAIINWVASYRYYPPENQRKGTGRAVSQPVQRLSVDYSAGGGDGGEAGDGTTR